MYLRVINYWYPNNKKWTVCSAKRGGTRCPFKARGGQETADGAVFFRITEEVEELTLPEAGGKTRRFDTICGYVL